MLDTLRTQIAFRVLFSNYAKKDTMCEVVGSTSNEEDGLDVFADPSYGLCDDVKSGFDSLQRSLMTTFIAGFLGDFDIGVMDDYELFMARDGTEGNYYYVQPYLAWFFFWDVHDARCGGSAQRTDCFHGRNIHRRQWEEERRVDSAEGRTTD